MQGFNMGRYRPPSSLDPSLAADGATAARKSRRLNDRDGPAGAQQQKQQPTIRFEMPFAIWCSTCPSHSSSQLIGQGVRFNAQKRKVGNYHSTPVWSFRMKHTPCGGWIEIRTDPQNAEYVVTEGARRRDTGDDLAVAVREGGVVIGGSAGPGEDNEREKKRQDAFAALEGKKEETARAKGEAARIDELKSLRERDWKDTDAASSRLRSAFRVGRKKREKDAASGEKLQERMGLGIDLLEEIEDDQKRASFVEFGADEDVAGLNASTKPLFGSPAPPAHLRGSKGDTRLDALRRELSNNTRAATDPFSANFTAADSNPPPRVLPGIKRKRELNPASASDSSMLLSKEVKYRQDPTHECSPDHFKSSATEAKLSLVDYDSD